MIGRRFSRRSDDNGQSGGDDAPLGFDAYDLRLGDVMRGERATLGKSLLDVERELRIRAAYIAAIENADPTVFDTPGFIPGYVRSYARYLGMDPDRAFGIFCDESGFSTAHGMSAEASGIRQLPHAHDRKPQKPPAADPIAAPKTPFLPESDGLLSRIEPGALGSALVLLTLIVTLGYGGWSVLREVQLVQIAPVENTPQVLADLDPVDAANVADGAGEAQGGNADFSAPRDERLSRLYRPQALDVPVMVARDAPISTLDPSKVGTLRSELPSADRRSFARAASRPAADSAEPGDATAQDASAASNSSPSSPKVVAETPPRLRVVAVRPAWVRVRAAGGSVIFEGILDAGDGYDVPVTDTPPTLRVGESGAVYFSVGESHYGPVGERGAVTSGIALAPSAVTGRFAQADPLQDRDLLRYVAELQPAADLPQE